MVDGTAEAKTYLHTLTFADPEPSIKEAARRFNNFFHGTGAGRRMGIKAVWCMQRGAKSGRLHFHLVTCRPLDYKAMWAALKKYGFGRYDCQKPQDASRAGYIARYVGRPGALEHGARSWGAVGFEKVKRKNVQQETHELVCTSFPPLFVLHAWFRIRLGEPHAASRRKFIIKRWGGEIDPNPSSAVKSPRIKCNGRS
jgi:uncharacterized protein YfiM (DUF2279 family)